ncbi:MAG TPA: hypothetical protein VFO41_11640 [Alphaproteobacteria bacterium]|nr:hypothetical protein [Alphaproteobacteria bacterium]
MGFGDPFRSAAIRRQGEDNLAVAVVDQVGEPEPALALGGAPLAQGE